MQPQKPEPASQFPAPLSDHTSPPAHFRLEGISTERGSAAAHPPIEKSSNPLEGTIVLGPDDRETSRNNFMMTRRRVQRVDNSLSKDTSAVLGSSGPTGPQTLASTGLNPIRGAKLRNLEKVIRTGNDADSSLVGSNLPSARNHSKEERKADYEMGSELERRKEKISTLVHSVERKSNKAAAMPSQPAGFHGKEGPPPLERKIMMSGASTKISTSHAISPHNREKVESNMSAGNGMFNVPEDEVQFPITPARAI